MTKKKIYKTKKETETVHEPSTTYGKRGIRIFSSFEELDNYELQEMAKLSSEQILQDLRKFINIAYGMHGYDPDKLPQKHTVKIIQRG
jgi:hypothetical protein